LGLAQASWLGTLLACGLGHAWAQPGIYACVDAKGRRLTSDRPIPECLDREQKVLGSDGTVKRKLGPALTAEERAAEEERQRRENEERVRQAEEKRREKALLARYPDQKTHDAQRAQALKAVEDVSATAEKRIAELAEQRKKIEGEAEFYRADPAKMPAKLKRQLEENDQHLAAQKRFIANQNEEKKRINAHFDEELAKLKQLWGRQTGLGAAAAAPPPPRATRN
jgi:hypothetical protein